MINEGALYRKHLFSKKRDIEMIKEEETSKEIQRAELQLAQAKARLADAKRTESQKERQFKAYIPVIPH